ncbi:DNA polymerase III subunit delta' [Arenimonas fontis]|uniref:DNA-directed DNA polymerase n=1 Tax=Arenimonas fontis TaxID=2608255 RepID=A0A5B2ZEK1_9GAMM|nr:DNA polymerase III subunit delta' [Arenimonas fontis]KAA2285620.1 DNA polymerase III subunit delta' [Arenimonas fontis]
MNAPDRFPPWQRRPLQAALSALAEGRLGHALLLCGPESMGKREVARVLAARLLCATPGGDGLACGHCRGCDLFAAGTHPDLQPVSYAINEKTGNPRSDIIVEQMRELSEWFALTPQLGGAKVALIQPAEALNAAASNALLKTLEEPSRDRYLLLVSDRPGQLLATLRSRCQRLEFRLPPAEEAHAWLAACGHREPALGRALHAARGHPGLAAEWLEQDGLALRESVRKGLEALAAGREPPVALAQAWLADERAALRLRFAAELALDSFAAGVGAGGRDRLTTPADFPKLSDWFDAINLARAQLQVPGLRHDLVLAGLLLEWRSLMGRERGRA